MAHPVGRKKSVALRKESVDRNQRIAKPFREQFVALRKESVDRNLKRSKVMKNRQVALRKESVDRNVFGFGAKLVHSCRSPQGERG